MTFAHKRRINQQLANVPYSNLSPTEMKTLKTALTAKAAMAVKVALLVRQTQARQAFKLGS